MLSENRAWGAIPSGFNKVTDSSGAYLVVREDRLKEIDASICRNDHGFTEDRGYHGRSALRAIRLQDGETALDSQLSTWRTFSRSYRHLVFYMAAAAISRALDH